MHTRRGPWPPPRSVALGVLGLLVCSGALAGTQTAPEGALFGQLRAHVAAEKFQLVTSIRGLPLGVRDGLQTLFGSGSLDIAEPGAPFQRTSVAMSPPQPTRRLVAAGCSMDHCLVYYERGGRAHTWQVALFHWTPDLTRFEWGGVAPSGLANIAAVHKAVLSGAVKGPNRIW